ncbi:MAG: hypothetical protein ABFD50_23835 [Smithella sp.]
MTSDEIRHKILQILYDTCLTDGIYGFMNEEDLVANIPADEEIIEKEFDYLLSQGLVDRPALGFVTITSKGIDKVETNPEFKILPAPEKPKIEIHSGNIGKKNQAHINNPSLFLDRLAEEIEKSTQIKQEKKKLWKKVLLEMSSDPWATEAVKKLLF